MGSTGTDTGWARRLVVESGDRISVEGRYVRFPDGEWLDIAVHSSASVRRLEHRPSVPGHRRS